MSGHSHASNIKHRKDRKDKARSELFLKLRKKITQLISEEGLISEKVLALARENSFPKEKIQQIWESYLAEKNKQLGQNLLVKADHNLVIFSEDSVNELNSIVKKENWKILPFSSLNNFFQICYSVELLIDDEHPENYLLEKIPLEILEFIEGLKITNNQVKFTFLNGNNNQLKAIINSEEKIKILAWQKKLIAPEVKKNTSLEEKEYYKSVKDKLTNLKYYSNIC